MNVKKIITILLALIFSISLADLNYVRGETLSEVNTQIVAKVEDTIIQRTNSNMEVYLKYPTVMLANNKGVEDLVNTAIKEHMKVIEDTAGKLEKRANEEFGLKPYHCNSDYIVTYNKNNILSIIINYNDYSGKDIYDVYFNEGLTFDLTTGKKLLLSDLFKEDKAEQMLKTIDICVSNAFKSKNEPIFYFNSTTKDTKYYLGDTYIEVYFNLYGNEDYISVMPSFKLPYSTFGENLKYKDLNDKNNRYNDSDVINALKDFVLYKDDTTYYMDTLGFNIDKDNSEVAMLYTAAKFLNDNYYIYYLTGEELETFAYHVYGKKLDAKEVLKDYDYTKYMPQRLEYKNDVYYFTIPYKENSLQEEFLKKESKSDDTTDVFGVVYDFVPSKKEKLYMFKLTYKKNSESALGYNILNYNWKEWNYTDSVVDEIEKSLNK